jgi:hypothetical protein
MSEPMTVVRGRDVRWRTVAVTAVVVVLFAIGLQSLNLLPSLPNPFGTKVNDRNNPVLLTSLTDLARFQAASGSFQVILDTEKDVQNVPSLVAGERTLFVATASVDSYVDFAALEKDAVTISADESASTSSCRLLRCRMCGSTLKRATSPRATAAC